MNLDSDRVLGMWLAFVGKWTAKQHWTKNIFWKMPWKTTLNEEFNLALTCLWTQGHQTEWWSRGHMASLCGEQWFGEVNMLIQHWDLKQTPEFEVRMLSLTVQFLEAEQEKMVFCCIVICIFISFPLPFPTPEWNEKVRLVWSKCLTD